MIQQVALQDARQACDNDWPVWLTTRSSRERIRGYVSRLDATSVTVITDAGPYRAHWTELTGFGLTNTEEPSNSLESVDALMAGAIRAIIAERDRQDRLKAEGRFQFTCADDGMSNTDRLACLVEEVGEVAQEVLTQKGRRLARDTDGSEQALREEITQVAAICVAWLESPCNSMPRMGW
jgi:NTP pyrophosphatase (non-canonical NTP hydrolase)